MLLTLSRIHKGSWKPIAAYPNRQNAVRYASGWLVLLLPPGNRRQRLAGNPCIGLRTLHSDRLSASTRSSNETHGRLRSRDRLLVPVRWSSTTTHSPQHHHDTPRSQSTGKSQNHDGSDAKFVPSRRALSRFVLITGGTSGIGYQIAKRALLEGASHVRIVTRDADRGASAVDKLRQETDTEAGVDYVQAEVDEYSDAKIFDLPNPPNHTPTQFNTLIHCAGITQTSLLSSTPPSTIQTLLKVNLESATLLSRTFLKRYHQTILASSRDRHTDSDASTPPTTGPPPPFPSWHFLTISSLLATKAGAGSAVYAATKAGLIALTRAVALEGAEISRRQSERKPGGPRLGFRANVVVPGYIDTPMTQGFSGRSRDGLIQQIPLGRFGRADEVADAVAFLLRNEYANNCVLNLDGGLSAT